MVVLGGLLFLMSEVPLYRRLDYPIFSALLYETRDGVCGGAGDDIGNADDLKSDPGLRSGVPRS